MKEKDWREENNEDEEIIPPTQKPKIPRQTDNPKKIFYLDVE
jgi:hypothetical protein